MAITPKIICKSKVKVLILAPPPALPLPRFTNSHYCNPTCVHKRARQVTRNFFPEFVKESSTTSCKRKKKRELSYYYPQSFAMW